MAETLKLRWFYILSGTFTALALAAIAGEFFWFAFVPVLLLVLYLAFFSMDTLIYLIVFSTPLAVILKDSDFNVGMSIPSEPLMFGIMLLFLFKVLHEGNYDKRALWHPITVAIIINLVWIALTVITSSMVIVSIKFLIARLWFVLVFYFLAVQLFAKIKNIKTFLWCYIVPFTIIIGYTVFRHAENGFTEKSAHWVMYPFYNDHTSYAAALTLFIPVLFSLTLDKTYSGWKRFMAGFFFLVFVGALVLSYTRAAWMGLVIALVFLPMILLRLRMSSILLIVIFGGLIFHQYREEIFLLLEKNKSSSSSDLAVHAKSISNVSTDASNRERINRWKSALRMYEERPAFGWGPGTYQFKYAPFQQRSEMTEISTNAGDRGNAHSEYIGPLAESGLPGSLTFIAIVFMVIARGLKIIYESKTQEIRLLATGLLLGLITYFAHGALNNFLDTDKLSVPFWGMIAALIALDVYHNKRGVGSSES
jgi:putative inorganic carbon (HCO3(-)) transporter